MNKETKKQIVFINKNAFPNVKYHYCDNCFLCIDKYIKECEQANYKCLSGTVGYCILKDKK
jgi:hypothetical protein